MPMKDPRKPERIIGTAHSRHSCGVIRLASRSAPLRSIILTPVVKDCSAWANISAMANRPISNGM